MRDNQTINHCSIYFRVEHNGKAANKWRNTMEKLAKNWTFTSRNEDIICFDWPQFWPWFNLFSVDDHDPFWTWSTHHLIVILFLLCWLHSADRRLFYFQSCWLYIYIIAKKKSIVRPLSVVLTNQIQKPLMWMGQSTSSHLLLSQIGSVHNYQRRCFVIKRGDVSWLGQWIMDFVVFKGANWCSYYNTYINIDYTCIIYIYIYNTYNTYICIFVIYSVTRWFRGIHRGFLGLQKDLEFRRIYGDSKQQWLNILYTFQFKNRVSIFHQAFCFVVLVLHVKEGRDYSCCLPMMVDCRTWINVGCWFWFSSLFFLFALFFFVKPYILCVVGLITIGNVKSQELNLRNQHFLDLEIPGLIIGSVPFL